MKRAVTLVILIMAGLVTQGMFVLQGFDRAAFYNAMQEQNLKDIDAQLNILEKSAIKEKLAFSGALLMKKAGLVKGPAQKLKIFKEGRDQLDAAVIKDTGNGEYRFLRLMIQENAPGILNYDNEIKEDSECVIRTFASLPHAAQKAIGSYSKKSRVLKPIQS